MPTISMPPFNCIIWLTGPLIPPRPLTQDMTSPPVSHRRHPLTAKKDRSLPLVMSLFRYIELYENDHRLEHFNGIKLNHVLGVIGILRSFSGHNRKLDICLEVSSTLFDVNANPSLSIIQSIFISMPSIVC